MIIFRSPTFIVRSTMQERLPSMPLPHVALKCLECLLAILKPEPCQFWITSPLQSNKTVPDCWNIEAHSVRNIWPRCTLPKQALHGPRRAELFSDTYLNSKLRLLRLTDILPSNLSTDGIPPS
jgi:hypothetical protein